MPTSAVRMNRDRPARPAAEVDPIDRVKGRSIELAGVLRWRGPDGIAYLSPNAGHLLEQAARAVRAAAMHDDAEAATIVTMADVLRTMLIARGKDVLTGSPFFREARKMFDGLAPDAPQPGSREGSVPRGETSGAGPILRWDVVEVLAEASLLRARTNPGQREIGLRHILVAAWRVRAGQLAFRETGLLRAGFDALRTRLLDLPVVSFRRYDDDVPAWATILEEVRAQPALVRASVTEARASYASDHVAADPHDPLGVAGDARALADLILLDAAKPPLAIGVFGPWGSGKSTLIAHLKKEVALQTAEERALRAQGEADRNPDTMRVGKVVQLDFNAWTFADSPNLWASFASEIFDQLAAGGIDKAGDRHGARLVAEVAARTSREMASLRTADAAVAQNEAGMLAAQRLRDDARRAVDTRILDAAADTARDLLIAAPDKPADRLHVTFDPPAKKKDREALEVFRDAVIGNDDDKPEKVIARYAESAGAIVRFGRIVYDYLSASWIRALLLLAVSAALVAVAVALWRILPPLWGVAASVPLLPIWVGIAYQLLLPAFRFAALYKQRYEKRKREAEASVRQAELELATYRQAHDAALQTRRTSEAFIAQYGGRDDPSLGASPGLMLDYLLKESDSVTAVRAREGVLATVRRAFNQLDAVIRRMREEAAAAPPGNPAVEAIDRIVLYIDDLDRCSARQVADILQAIHLLLAFPCFVVVAAVDARWLRHSLESAHEQFAPVDPGTDHAHPGLPPDRPTTADYLEKIFQVAFWVRPLVDTDAQGDARYAPYARYVDHLFGETRAAPDPATTGRDLPAPPSSREVAVDDFIAVDPSAPAAVDLPRRERLQITPAEQALFKALGPLAAKSPRAVKRMINIYRLIRVSYRDEALAGFLGSGTSTIPTYRAILFALACEMGLPATVVALLDGCTRAMPPDEWSRFVTEGVGDEAGRPVADSLHQTENIARLARRLDALRLRRSFWLGLQALRDDGGPPLAQADMILALDDVRRYSFRLG